VKMNAMISMIRAVVLAMVVCEAQTVVAQDSVPKLSMQHGDHQVVIKVDGASVAAYVFSDPKVQRPYFAHVKAPGNIQVTRQHPPVEGEDLTDHDTMHPGLWLAFGDLGGQDFWRNKARVVHAKFLQPPAASDDGVGFVEEKHYLNNDGLVLCREEFRCSFRILPGGYLLTWDSTFTGDRTFAFGDQEEMGLGMRVATRISEVRGGRLSDSEGRTSAKQIWSNAADWCDYSGTVDDQRVGMTILCHPENLRPSWMHARDYGLVAANMFGRKAMRKGETSSLEVQPSESLRLRYGVWIHADSGSDAATIQQTYDDYAKTR